MVSNEDIFFIPGVNEIIMCYKHDMDEIIRKRVAKRQHKSLMKHVSRMRSNSEQQTSYRY